MSEEETSDRADLFGDSTLTAAYGLQIGVLPGTDPRVYAKEAMSQLMTMDLAATRARLADVVARNPDADVCEVIVQFALPSVREPLRFTFEEFQDWIAPIDDALEGNT